MKIVFPSSLFLLLSLFSLLLTFLSFLPPNCWEYPHIYRFLVVLFLISYFLFIYPRVYVRHFFLSLFMLCHPKFVIHESFLTNLFFWNLDMKWGSYELFLYLAFSVFFPFFLFSCFFYFWKTPLTLYPFKFLPPLILNPFILSFIIRPLSIQHVLQQSFLTNKDWFHTIDVKCCIDMVLQWSD